MGLFGKGETITLQVEGMTCGHCVMSVTKALEELPGVKKAKVTLNQKVALVTLAKDSPSSTDEMIAAIKAAGFEASVQN